MSKAGKFSMVSRTIWRSERFRALESHRAQLLFFYYLTCEHQNALGCFRLPDGYAISDLGWTLQEYQVSKAECIGVGLIDCDDETQEILVVKWLENNPPQNQKHLQGLIKANLAIESDDFRNRLADVLCAMAGQVQPSPEPRRPY
ncbi:hypothetical protein GB928_018635 [Shinella curvata]|uniref:Uncharacterized protein n=1 Tax=Shinella curvata TaxID=1817964 RepID=A0ABT8XHK6_9HYPH|nr:hypothetical protein [Shinella curvata]MCJ8053877.1 hypothetical protein [Shinella curvata]MDO6123209.1 hypothetical protein [Shinella curvata]